jgi:hypothetical protein
MRRIAVLSGLVVLVGGLLGPSAAFAGQDKGSPQEEPRWIAVEDQFAVVLPDGQTFSGDQSGPPSQSPPVGTRFFISEVLHATQDGKTPGAEVGRSHIECTVQVVPNDALCSASFTFNDRSQLTLDTDFNLAATTASFDVAVTGGTGHWAGATGVVTATDMSTSPNRSVTLYVADIELPRD